MDCTRDGRSIDEFVRDWECQLQSAEAHGLVCSDEMKAFLLIRSVRLSQGQRASLLLQMEQAVALQTDSNAPLPYQRVVTMVRAIAHAFEIGQDQRAQQGSLAGGADLQTTLLAAGEELDPSVGAISEVDAGERVLCRQGVAARTGPHLEAFERSQVGR